MQQGGQELRFAAAMLCSGLSILHARNLCGYRDTPTEESIARTAEIPLVKNWMDSIVVDTGTNKDELMTRYAEYNPALLAVELTSVMDKLSLIAGEEILLPILVARDRLLDLSAWEGEAVSA
jgi:hypothetical protein